MTLIRVVIADDHTLLRAGLCGFLASLDGIECVGEAADGIEAITLIESLRPDVLMTDISMPRLDGLGLTTAVARDYPSTRVIILSMHTEKRYVEKALQAGAMGYLVKDSGTAEVELAVRSVARGDSYLSPTVSRHVVSEYARLTEAEAAQDPLTPRQREILKLIAEGLTTKAIARHLKISTKTADTHRVQLMDRLNIHDIAGLVRYAIRTGLVDPDV